MISKKGKKGKKGSKNCAISLKIIFAFVLFCFSLFKNHRWIKKQKVAKLYKNSVMVNGKKAAAFDF